MKKWMMAAAVAAAMTTMLAAPVDAARLGGGRSMGRQSPSVMQRDATPAAPASPSALPQSPAAQPGLRAPAAGAAAATAAQSARSRWMAPLAGIAAGLGLAWLAHSLGFGDGLATVLLIALLAMAGLALFRMLRARSVGGAQPALAGAYRPGSTAGPQAAAPMARQADSQAPAQPSASGSAAPGAAATGMAAQPAAAGLKVPAGFDTEGFVRNAKAQFVRLQAAYDAADLNDLREFTSPQMFDEVKADIDQRGASPNRTEVVSLDARFLGIETDAAEHTASVRFSGLIREGHDAQPAPFDEVWNLTRPVSGRGGWVLAGIQQLA